MPDASVPDPQGTDALARARRTRVLVIGGGVAGLVAALEWAKIGAGVTVLEASDRFGGMVETVELDGLPIDTVADAFPLGSVAFAALLDELRLRESVEPAAPLPVWIAALPGDAAAPAPEATVLGIPANPWAADVRRVIGWGGAWRAYLDRLRPPLTIGHERSLGRLVRSRMGDRVVDRLVAPVTRGVYGVDPDEVDVEVAAPGLSTALTRTGSLSGAAFDLLPDDAAAPTRATLRGGMGGLVAALVARLGDLGADLRIATEVVAVQRDDAWQVSVAETGADRTLDAAGDTPDLLEADVVVVATGGAEATRLLESAGAAVSSSARSPRDVVTLVVASRALDAAPRGRAVYAATQDAPAFGVAQATADWPWLAAAAGAGRHVLRVTLPADPERSDEQRATDAARAAEALLAVPLETPRAGIRRRVDAALPASVLGHDDRVQAIRAAVARRPGLAVVGAWVSGTGIAQIASDAVAEVDRMRSAVLWGAEGSPRDGADAAEADPT